jgi:hypothetical protein
LRSLLAVTAEAGKGLKLPELFFCEAAASKFQQPRLAQENRRIPLKTEQHKNARNQEKKVDASRNWP